MTGVSVVGRVHFKVLATDVTLIRIAHTIDHCRVCFQPPALLQTPHKYPCDIGTLAFQRGFLSQ